MRRPSSLLAAALLAGCGAVEPLDEPATPPVDAGLGDIEFLSPGEEAGSPVPLRVDAPDGVVAVRYIDDAGGWTIGESLDRSSDFEVTGTFTLGGHRTVLAWGLDDQPRIVAEGSHRFDHIVPPGGRFGLWLPDLGAVGLDADELAQRLGDLGVGRLYVRVADGAPDCDEVPAACDPDLPAALRDAGVQPWAWVDTDPADPVAQADVLLDVAPLGYVGVQLMIGDRFDERPDALRTLAFEFVIARSACIGAGLHVGEFPILLTVPPDLAARGLDPAELADVVDGWAPLISADDSLEQTWCDLEPHAGMVAPVLGLDGLPDDLAASLAIAGPDASVWQVPLAGDAAGWAAIEAVDWTTTEFEVPSCE